MSSRQLTNWTWTEWERQHLEIKQKTLQQTTWNKTQARSMQAGSFDRVKQREKSRKPRIHFQKPGFRLPVGTPVGFWVLTGLFGLGLALGDALTELKACWQSQYWSFISWVTDAWATGWWIARMRWRPAMSWASIYYTIVFFSNKLSTLKSSNSRLR